MSGKELGRLGEKEVFWLDEPEPAELSTFKSFRIKPGGKKNFQPEVQHQAVPADRGQERGQSAAWVEGGWEKNGQLYPEAFFF